MTRVLVTGATGFTGTHLVKHLLAAGHDVRAIARHPARAREMLPEQVEIVAGDITDRAVVGQAVKGREVIYHLAAAFREAGIPDARYREVHVEATRSLLEASSAEGVRRFVHCSTVGVHSHIECPPADENCPHNPGDIYQSTKSEGERLAVDFARTRGLPLCVIRPATIYGPGDLRLLKLFRAVARRHFVMLGRGEVFLHMVHVADLVRAFLLAAERPQAAGEVFIIAGPEYVSLNELVSRIAAIYGVRPPGWHLPVWPFFLAGALCELVCVPLGVEPPIYRRRVAFFTKSRAFSIDKARRVLGFEPAVDLQRGLEETAGWYVEKGYV